MKLAAGPGVAQDDRPSEDPFAAFRSEIMAESPAVSRPRAARAFPSLQKPLVFAPLVAIVVVAIAIVAFIRLPAPVAAATAPLTITSSPPGATVVIDDAVRGVTPLSMTVSPGTHRLTLRANGAAREMIVTTRPNVETMQNVELLEPVGTAGSLSVISDPPALRVAIDGTPRGTTPTVIDHLTPGTHQVSLTGGGISARRSVTVHAGTTASLVVSQEKAARTSEPALGYLTVSSPIEVTLYEGETLVGNSRSARLYLPPGSHTLTAVNEELNFNRTIPVSVNPGKHHGLTIPVPTTTLNVNAQPWAEVSLDGKSLGETPIGNIAVSIGTHELMFRHPQLGERRETVVIAAGRPARVAVDLRR